MLETVPARVLRLYYNLVNYDSILNYDPTDDFSYARNLDKKFSHFFQTAEYYMKNKNENILSNSQKLNEDEKKILEELKDLKVKVHEHFCDNFAIPKVIFGL
jgi:cysteinyl-tRNA synthetase